MSHTVIAYPSGGIDVKMKSPSVADVVSAAEMKVLVSQVRVRKIVLPLPDEAGLLWFVESCEQVLEIWW